MNEEKSEIYKKWELITEDRHTRTERLKVPGGFIYRADDGHTAGSTLCFVPDVDLQRYQAHLRDAYNKGFEDGSRETHSQYKKCST